MAMRRALFVALALFGASLSRAERINHAGRILGPLQTPTVATLFNTVQADSIMASMQIFPRDSAWNEVIETRPLLPNSAAIIAMIRSELASDRRNLRGFYEMNFSLVPNGQPLVPIPFFEYPDESDPGPYPIPTIQPIELWPVNTEGQTLDQWQRDVYGWGGDRHGLIAQPGTGDLYETWQMKKLSNGSWVAANGAKFDLNSNSMRPAGWTSGDAAGLAMFPALVRFDEVQRGEIEHALRIVVKHTRREYIYPARHFASSPPTTDPSVPAMGQRLRLKASFAIPAGWSAQSKCVARALKKYGALVADNGNFFSISITPDNRWPTGCFNDLWDVDVNDFEVVQTTGEFEGPRSPNPPTANAGADRVGSVGVPVSLPGTVSGGSGPLDVLWSKYSGPGNVAFQSASSASTSATFSAAGTYTLLLKAADDVHTSGYDAVIVTISSGGAIAGLSANPNPIDGGYTATGTVTLASQAPPGGAKVWLTDTLPALTTPASLIVLGGTTSRTFTVSALVVTTAQTGTLTASYSGSQKALTVTVQPGPRIQSLSVSPVSVVGGNLAVGKLVLDKPAPVGGTPVSLSDSSAYVSTVASAKVPAGAMELSFTVNTLPTPATVLANLAASIPGSAQGTQVTVKTAGLSTLMVTPSSVQGGQSAIGTVTLDGKSAGAGGDVNLADNSQRVSVPPKATVPAGQTSTQFAIATQAVPYPQTATITAKRLGVVRTATLTLTP